ncbi:hypothetical protein BOTBODRAFT_119527 [Botryobasidium botryosum FD-172 SS1]|uniref:Methyltransferase domain-containing protein n=1 Tax=Botryobasidium botryosum (strain FD-172 SS1) TaxID=930990 RepID=A0A067M8E7_BOTB1|nr:hypothetical protein BOTBODRAFT_119527 [Botryobasidium botryosum FD-172 SS1]
MANEAGPLDPDQYQVDDADKGFFAAAISPDEDVVRQRVIDIQKKAYEACPYPCIRMFYFISLRMKGHPTYKEVIAHGGKDNALFLDLGCCMGTDVRNAAYEGYPASQLVGSDLLETYLTLGKELYNDKETGKIKFIAADVFDLPPIRSTAPRISSLDGVTQLDDLAGSLTFIYTGSVFHLFSAQKQKELALRLLRLWTREPGAIIFGRHQGKAEEGYLAEGRPEMDIYGHSPKTFTAMWKEAIEEFEGEGAAEKIVVEVELRDWVKRLGSLSRDTVTLVWTVRRV